MRHAWILGVLVGCSGATAPPVEAAEERVEEPNPLLGAWHLEALAPEAETQLSHECYVFVSAVHYSDPRLTFARDSVLFHAGSIGGVAMSVDQPVPYRIDADRVVLDTTGFTTPPSVLIPCGAMPSELVVAPSGARLLENVVHCAPCASEPAIDGVVGVTWVRD